jgi:transglutaminase/protease-like cytokinesis protein 3
MPDEQKSVYNHILHSLYAHQKDVKIISPFKIDTVLKIAHSVLFDNPELFYVDKNEIPYSYNHSHAVINFIFLYNQSEINDITRKIQRKVQPILQNLENSEKSASGDDFEKEKKIHDFLVQNIQYNHAKDTNPVFHSIVGALLNGAAVCSGYSNAFKYLCDLSGISCIYVTGEALNPAGVLENHAWNIVKINNACYHVDVTWNSSSRINKNDVCYDYFNISDAYLKTDHIWDMQKYPKCDLTSAIIPYITSSSDFKNHITAQIKAKNKNFSMRINKKFKDEEEIYKIIQNAIPLTSRIFISGITLRYNKNQDIIGISIN